MNYQPGWHKDKKATHARLSYRVEISLLLFPIFTEVFDDVQVDEICTQSDLVAFLCQNH